MLRANLIALAALVVVGAALLLWQQPWRASDTTGAAGVYPADAVRRLDDQLRAMSEATDPRAFIEAAGGGDVAETIAAAMDALRADDVDFGYVEGGEAPTRDDDTTTVTTRIAWQADGSVLPAGRRETTAVLRFRLAGDRFVLSGAEAQEDDPVPLWLAGPVTVDVDAGAVVIGAGRASRTAELRSAAEQAAATVRRSLETAPDDPLVVVTPGDAADLQRILGRGPDEAARIAAVTTRLDGGDAPVVVLNPAVFFAMDDRAQRIVLTHEAVHQLTGVVGSSVDDAMWVVEGFADWVALQGDAADLAVSAGRILAEVRRDGPPDHLPSAEDFADAGRVTAVYESAWLAIRMLAERYGPAAVEQFYAAVADGAEVDAALAGIGTDLPTVTAQWRDYLTYSASTVS